MTDQIDLKQICLDAAKDIADSMSAAENLAEKTDALKALTALYTAFRKHPTEDDEDEKDGFDFSRGVQAPASQDHSNGSAPRLHTGRRRNTAVS